MLTSPRSRSELLAETLDRLWYTRGSGAPESSYTCDTVSTLGETTPLNNALDASPGSAPAPGRRVESKVAERELSLRRELDRLLKFTPASSMGSILDWDAPSALPSGVSRRAVSANLLELAVFLSHARLSSKELRAVSVVLQAITHACERQLVRRAQRDGTRSTAAYGLIESRMEVISSGKAQLGKES